MQNQDIDKIINHQDGLNIAAALNCISAAKTLKNILVLPTVSMSTISASKVPVYIKDYLVNYDPYTMDLSGDESAVSSGTYSLTVTPKTGYKWSDGTIAAKTVSWTFEKLRAAGSSWSTSTDDEIAAAVAAADAGDLDLTEYWSIGDERTVSLSAMTATGVGESHVAQDVVFVIVAIDTKTTDGTTNPCYNYHYVTATTGRTYPSFIVQQKHCLGSDASERGYMNSTNTNNGSWGLCARKTWCDNVYRSAISSSTLRDIFKQVYVKTAATYNGSTMQESSCYFFFPAAAEVFKGDSYYGQGGTAGKQTAYSNLTEWNKLSQWSYYATAANRIKNQSGSAYFWWERSPFYTNSLAFCMVDDWGDASNIDAGIAYGIAPAGCI